MKATWNNAVIAESNDTIVVEGNHYFPPNSIKQEYFVKSSHESVCSWKGTASYLTVKVGSQENKDACWYYQNPKSRAQNIKGYYAFWKGVKVE